MTQFVIRRLVITVPLLLGLTLITFVLTQLMPGDFVTAMISPDSGTRSVEAREALRESYGLNKSPPERYFLWLREVSAGNLGYSFKSGEPVLSEIVKRVPATLSLTVIALLFGIVVGTVLGLISAVKQYSWLDQVLTVLGFVWISTPGFVFAIAAIYIFSLKLAIFPSVGSTSYGESAGLLDRLHHLVLPATVLGLGSVASFMRYARSSLLEVIRQDFVQVARAKGLSEGRVRRSHAFRNALIPLITIIGLDVPWLLSGSIIIERIFAWPGMGSYALSAITSRDYPVIMGINFVVSLIVLLTNLVTDIAYAIVDPRIRYQ